MDSPVLIDKLKQLSNGEPLKLHLGCGEKYFDGYINIDYPSENHKVMNVKADVYCDIKTIDLPENSVDEIRLHHVFEHFSRIDALALLIKWHKWLKKGGRLHIEVPDLIGSAKTLLSDVSFKVKMGVVRHLAGDQANSWGFHVDHWFDERFRQTLQELGFSSIQSRLSQWMSEPYLSNITVLASKERDVSLDQQLDAADRLLLVSMVSPAEHKTYNVWKAQLRQALLDTPTQAKKSQSDIKAVVFSKDRAMQLMAAIESFVLHCKDSDDVDMTVLYKASNDLHSRQYNELKHIFADVHFIEETNLRDQLLSVVDGSGYTLFLVDDNIFVRPFNINSAVTALNNHNGAIGFSLRLGRNVTYSYARDCSEVQPQFESVDENVLKFKWYDIKGSFGYPLEVSSSIYRTEHIVKLLSGLNFSNPNTLESEMDESKANFFNFSYLLTFDKSVTFCNPINKTQQIYENRSGNNPGFSVDKLAEFFNEKKAIDVSKYVGFVPNSPHQEVELYFKNRGNVEGSSVLPKISVLICVYNGERFVRKTIESIQKQSFQDFEIIIVDDASTDETPAILREMKDSRTFIYRNGQNLGPCKSANVGIGLCRGEYIIRSDADDISVPERFEKQLKVMQANPDCVAAGSWVQWIDENDNPKGTWKPVTQPDEIHRRLLIKNAIAHGSSIIRKEALLSINGYDENFKYSLDYDLWLRLCEIGKLMNIPELLYQLRAWDGSISVTKKDQQEKLAKQALANAFRRRGIRQPNQEDREGELVLSVVLTTYNRNDMLSRVLEGFANQNCDLKSYEVVVVDDGSNPKAQSVVEKFQSRMNTVYVYQDNSGLAASRNAGIKCSNGKIILFSDDDDIPDENLVAEHIRSHQQNPNDSVAVLGHLQWHNDLKITTLMDYVTGVGGEYFGYLSMRHGQFYPVWKWWGGLISAKKNLLKSVEGPFDERLCFGYEDTELACRLLNKDVKILYNANAKSYILRGIDYKEFCERRYKQGRALYFVACKHTEIINNRYGLHNVEQIYSKDYQPNLEKWCNKICEFKDSLDDLRNSIQPADMPVIEAVYTLYRESFKGFWLKGFVDQAHEIQQGKMNLDDPVNAQAPTLKIKASMTNIQNKPLPTKNKITFISYCMPICEVGSSNVRIFEMLKVLVARGYDIDFIYNNHSEEDVRYIDMFEGRVNFRHILFDINLMANQIADRKGNLPQVLWITNIWTDHDIQFANMLTDYFRIESPDMKIIIDTMDFHYKKYYRKFKCSGNETDKLTAQRLLDCERKLYPKADSVMVVSESERADIQSQINCTVDVIPNIHSLANYDKSINERRDICFIGGMGISHNRDAVKWFIQNIFPLILEKRPDVKFNLLGFGNEHFKNVLEKHPNIKVPGYVENAEEAMSNYRVFVCPLTYGAGMKGKLGSAAVAGTAIVSTTVGVEGFDFVDGQNCFIADDPYQFADKCVRLLNDDQIWKNFSVNAQKMVCGNFSPEAVGSRIDGVLGRLLKAPIGIAKKVEKLKASIAISCSNSEKLIDECVQSGVV